MIIDWPALRAAAVAAAEHAYAPYSGLRVGAAGQAADGRVVTGCNVENASYGLTLCAECGLVSALHASGVAALHASGVAASPAAAQARCGPSPSSRVTASRCCPAAAAASCCSRPAAASLLVDTAEGPVELGVLLPAAFSGADLAQRKETQRREHSAGQREETQREETQREETQREETQR